MRRFALSLLAVAALALGAGTASAADLGQRPVYKAPPAPVMAAYNWSGFYVGGHLGYGWGSEEARFTASGLTGATDPDGFLAGAQLGFNWQTGAFVFGIEGDWTWTNADGTSATAVASDHNWYGSATGRLGYAWDNWLLYVKGGAAWMDADYTFGGTGGGTRSGWTLGTGLEWAVGNNWSAKLEYNYMDFGSETYTLPTSTAIDTQVHLIKLGLNYRFGLGGPVATRY